MLSLISAAILPCLASADQSLFSVATGRHFSFYVDKGVAYASGRNKYGQLGLQDNDDRTGFVPVPMPELAGDAVAVKAEETGATTGASTGAPTPALTEAPTPAPTPAGPKVKQIAAGAFHTIFLLTTGDAYTVGRNNFGQLGVGSTEDSNKLTKVTFEEDPACKVKAVAAGYGHSVFLVESTEGLGAYCNGVWTAGYNNVGQAGLGGNPVVTPQLGHGCWNCTGIAAGYDSTFAVGQLAPSDPSGEVYAAGQNVGGQLGLGKAMPQGDFGKVDGLSDVTEVFAGESHALFMTGSGLYGTGATFDGQLTGTRTEPVFTPELLSINGVLGAGAGGDSSCIADWQLKCFGSNRDGQLGLNTAQFVTSPIAVQTVTNYPMGMDFTDGIAIADTHSVFLNHDAVVVTGTNKFGELGDNDTTTVRVPKKLTSLERDERTTTEAPPTPSPTPAPPTPRATPAPGATPAPSPEATRDPGSDTEEPGDGPDRLMIILGVAVALSVVLLLVSLARGGNTDGQDVQQVGDQNEDLELIRAQGSMN